MFQRRITLSPPAVASVLPSGANASDQTGPSLCAALIVARAVAPVPIVHRRIVPLASAAASVLPVGENARAPACLWFSLATCLKSGRLQITIVPAGSLAAIILPSARAA